MGAGYPWSKRRHVLYHRCKKYQRILAAAGIPSTYKEWTLVGDGWSLYYKTIWASNGESASLVRVVGTQADHIRKVLDIREL